MSLQESDAIRDRRLLIRCGIVMLRGIRPDSSSPLTDPPGPVPGRVAGRRRSHPDLAVGTVRVHVQRRMGNPAVHGRPVHHGRRIVQDRGHQDVWASWRPSSLAATSCVTTMLILVISTLVSGFIDNVPYVATMTPIVSHLASTIAGPLASPRAVVVAGAGRRLGRQPDRRGIQCQHRHARHRHAIRPPHLLLANSPARAW